MGKLDGKVAIITGASSGIGKQIAIKYCEEGAKVAICARRQAKLDETRKLCEAAGGECLVMVCDVADEKSLKKFFDATVERFGKVDILINNAIKDPNQCGGPLIHKTIEDLEEMLHSGLYSTWRLMHWCYPVMKENGGGSIINVCSAAGVVGRELLGTYATTKEAVRGLSRVAAHEWGVDNIRTNILLPASLTDSMLSPESEGGVADVYKEAIIQEFNNANPMKKAGDSYRDIAPVCVFLGSEDSGFINGQSIAVDGGYLYSC